MQGKILKQITNTVFRGIAYGWPILLLLIVWEVWIYLSDIPRIIAPSPKHVFLSMLQNYPAYMNDMATTLQTSVYGWLIGVATGFLLAIFTWISPFFVGLITPATLVIRSVPLIAMIPLLGRIFGYNDETVVWITGMISFFPTFVFTSSGLYRTPSGSNELFDVLGTAWYRRLCFLAVPSAIPSLLVSLRISVSGCVIGAVTAEYLIGTQGLGHLLAVAQSLVLVEQGWMISLVATIISVILFLIVSQFELWILKKIK